MVWLTIRFGNTRYIVTFAVDERLEVDVIIGTAFMNEQVIPIRCREQVVQFRRDMVPILGIGTVSVVAKTPFGD